MLYLVNCAANTVKFDRKRFLIIDSQFIRQIAIFPTVRRQKTVASRRPIAVRRRRAVDLVTSHGALSQGSRVRLNV